MPISSPSTLSKELYQRAERIAGALDGMETKYSLVRADLLVLMLHRRNKTMRRPQANVRLFYRPPRQPKPQCFALFIAPSGALSSLQVRL